MKIAVASNEGMVAGHFGHCGAFDVFDTTEENIIKHESIKNPGHKPGFLPKFLKELGVEVIIGGGMGASAINLFNNYGVKVLVGAEGACKSVVESYLSGDLVSKGSACEEHQNGCH
jgi:predicted Fe-Mo cluster-binding NifX family protein